MTVFDAGVSIGESGYTIPTTIFGNVSIRDKNTSGLLLNIGDPSDPEIHIFTLYRPDTNAQVIDVSLGMGDPIGIFLSSGLPLKLTGDLNINNSSSAEVLYLDYTNDTIRFGKTDKGFVSINYATDNQPYIVLNYGYTLEFKLDANTKTLSSTDTLNLKDVNLTSAIPLSESGVTGLVGFTATSIIGGLNEVRAAIGANLWSRVTGTPNYLEPATNTDSVYIQTNLQLGVVDAFARTGIWNKLPSSILRMGSNTSDGDPTDVDSEGIVVWQPTSDQAARVKAYRFALSLSSDTSKRYYEATTTFLALRKNVAGVFSNTFYVDSTSGDTTLGGTLIAEKLNLNGKKLKIPVAIGDAAAGDCYFDPTTAILYVHDGSNWKGVQLT